MARRTFSRKLAEAHLLSLAARHDIEITWLMPFMGKHEYAESFITTRQIRTPFPWNFRMYLIGLHEFGHILCPLAVELHRRFPTEDNLPGYIAKEAAADAWAIENIDPDLAHWVTARASEAPKWRWMRGYHHVGFALSRTLYDALRSRRA